MFLWENLIDRSKDFQAPDRIFPTEALVLEFLWERLADMTKDFQAPGDFFPQKAWFWNFCGKKWLEKPDICKLRTEIFP